MKEPKCPLAGMVCPRNNDPKAGKYCPAWTEYMETNLSTGEERMQKECVFSALPKFMIETLKASNRPAAAVESTRNEIADGFKHIHQQMQRIPALLLEKDDGEKG